MINKLIEIRDNATKINAMITKMVPTEMVNNNNPNKYFRNVEYKILRDSGYPIIDNPLILLTELESGRSQYDPYKWDNNTMRSAHRYINHHFDEIPNGWVVDVETINEDKATMKLPERYTSYVPNSGLVNDKYITFYLLENDDYNNIYQLIDYLKESYDINIDVIDDPDNDLGIPQVNIPYEDLENLGLQIYELIPKYLIPTR